MLRDCFGLGSGGVVALKTLRKFGRKEKLSSKLAQVSHGQKALNPVQRQEEEEPGPQRRRLTEDLRHSAKGEVSIAFINVDWKYIEDWERKEVDDWDFGNRVKVRFDRWLVEGTIQW